MTSHTGPSRFSAYNIKKLGMGLETRLYLLWTRSDRSQTSTCTCTHQYYKYMLYNITVSVNRYTYNVYSQECLMIMRRKREGKERKLPTWKIKISKFSHGSHVTKFRHWWHKSMYIQCTTVDSGDPRILPMGVLTRNAHVCACDFRTTSTSDGHAYCFLGGAHHQQNKGEL